jgi:hypothetical protein
VTLASMLVVRSASAWECQPFGWRKVAEKSISMTERLCVYEKNGVQVSIIVSGFCPFDPC